MTNYQQLSKVVHLSACEPVSPSALL